MNNKELLKQCWLYFKASRYNGTSYTFFDDAGEPFTVTAEEQTKREYLYNLLSDKFE